MCRVMERSISDSCVTHIGWTWWRVQKRLHVAKQS